MPLGISNQKVEITFACGTPQMCSVGVFVTIVDTPAYDVLLGMEFIQARSGAYDSWRDKKGRQVKLTFVGQLSCVGSAADFSD